MLGKILDLLQLIRALGTNNNKKPGTESLNTIPATVSVQTAEKTSTSPWPVQRTNARGLKLLQSFEGCKLKAYQDVRKVWTIGWGNTGPDIIEGLEWTQQQADQALTDRLAREFEPQVQKLLAEFKMEVSANAFSALVSFTYNCGAGNTKKLLAGGLDQLPKNILTYNKAGGVEYLGLTRRRRAELDLFLSTEV